MSNAPLLTLVRPIASPRRAPHRPKGLVPISWCVRGMKVYAPKFKQGWVLCVVVCRSGYTARVVNELHGIDTWFHIDWLRVPREHHFALC